MRLTLYIATCLLVLLSCSCTKVDIYTEGEVDTSWYFGFPNINVNSQDQSVTVKTHSIGLVNSPQSFNFGYLNETLHVSANDCELILFEPDNEAISELESLIEVNKSICNSKGGD